MRALLTLLTLAACPTATEPEPLPERWGSLPLPASSCVGDGDAVLAAEEIVFDLAAGLVSASRLSALGEVVSLPGLAGDGPWDLSEPLLNEEGLELGPEPPGSSWAAPRYADAELLSLLDAHTGSQGVFAKDDAGGLVLLGLTSLEPDRDALRYDPPVPFLPAGMEMGDTWEVDAEASGLVGGVEYPQQLGAEGVVSLRHVYAFTASGASDLALPGLTLPVLRLDLRLRVEAWNSLAGLFASRSSRVQSYVAECLGVVARVRSLPDEQELRFTQAAELLRLGLLDGVSP